MTDDTWGCYHDMPTAIETYSGGRFDLADPKPSDVRPADVAHALARIGRYGGHCRCFYSVAAHSIHCHDEAVRRGLPPFLCLGALVHDGGEAYTNDLGRPIKHAPGMEGYRRMSEAVQECVYSRFFLSFHGDEFSGLSEKVIKEIDNATLAAEVPRLMRSGGKGWRGLDKIEPAHIPWWSWWWHLPPRRAEAGFLRRLRGYGIVV